MDEHNISLPYLSVESPVRTELSEGYRNLKYTVMQFCDELYFIGTDIRSNETRITLINHDQLCALIYIPELSEIYFGYEAIASSKSQKDFLSSIFEIFKSNMNLS